MTKIDFELLDKKIHAHGGVHIPLINAVQLEITRSTFGRRYTLHAITPQRRRVYVSGFEAGGWHTTDAGAVKIHEDMCNELGRGWLRRTATEQAFKVRGLSRDDLQKCIDMARRQARSEKAERLGNPKQAEYLKKIEAFLDKRYPGRKHERERRRSHFPSLYSVSEPS